MLNVKHDIVIGIVYISPNNSTYTKGLTEQVWDIIEEELLQFVDNEQITLAGDFNARTGSLPDYIVNDDDTFCPVPDIYSADPAMCTRINRDRNVCAYGNRLLELCQKSNLRILNGRKIGDSIGNLTCHKYNGSSTVDYFIGSTKLFSNVRYMKVHDWLPCSSDHCPVSVCLNTGTRRNLSLDKNYEKEIAPPKVKWDPIKMLVFQDKLQSPVVKEKLQSLLMMKIQNGSECEQTLSEINTILRDAGDIRISRKNKQKKKMKKNKEWFDKDLACLKQELMILSMRVKRDYKNEFLRGKLFTLKKTLQKNCYTQKE